MRSRKGWPENLEAETKGAATYYRYRDPDTGRSTGLGTDFKTAADAVKVVNAKRAMARNPVAQLLSRIETPGRTLKDHIGKFRDALRARRFKTGHGLSPSTLRQYDLQLDTFEAEIGPALDVATITRKQIAQFLDKLPATASVRYRSLLAQLFQHAVADGLREDNPVELTLERDVVVLRKRLTLEWYEAIHKAAKEDPGYQAAMNLARRSLQRREDLVLMEFKHYAGGVLTVRQLKLRSRGLGLIKVHAGPKLQAGIEQCRDGLVSPYLLHRRNEFRNNKRGEWRKHWTQLSPDQLTKPFAALRDELGICSDLPANQRPSFHEIRAFGADEMRQAGEQEESIQLLLGHTDKKTTQLYLERHGERWAEAKSA